MRWRNNRNRAAGGCWRCLIKEREYARVRGPGWRAYQAEWLRRKYDSDPVYRLESLLKHARRERLKTIRRLRESTKSPTTEV